MNIKENIFNEALSEKEKEIVNSFKELPDDFWDFKECDTNYSVHGIHSYPATMIYPISKNIIDIMKNHIKIKSLLDPFEGSGTVLVEGINADIQEVYGNDLNPLASLITKVKTTKIDSNELISEKKQFLERLENDYGIYLNDIDNIEHALKEEYHCVDFSTKEGWGENGYAYITDYLNKQHKNLDIPNFKNIGYWFKPKVIIELGIIKKEVLNIKKDDIRDVFLLTLSEVVRRVSNRRNGEFKMYRIPSDKVNSFNPDTKNEFIKTLDRNIIKITEYSNSIAQKNYKVHLSNENSMNISSIPNDSIDMVITSPPYGDSRTTVAYGEFSKVSLNWINLNDTEEEKIKCIDKSLMGGQNIKIESEFLSEVSSKTLNDSLDRIIKKDSKRAGDVYSFYVDLEKSIYEISKKLKSGGFEFWVVGNRIVKEEKLNTDVIIAEIAQKYGLKHIFTFERNISNKTMPLKNSPTNKSGKTVSTMNKEYIIVLEKI